MYALTFSWTGNGKVGLQQLEVPLCLPHPHLQNLGANIIPSTIHVCTFENILEMFYLFA